MSDRRGAGLRRAAARGAVAGLAGVAVMTAGEKAEQAVTGRPSSYVQSGRSSVTVSGLAAGAASSRRTSEDAAAAETWSWAVASRAASVRRRRKFRVMGADEWA